MSHLNRSRIWVAAVTLGWMAFLYSPFSNGVPSAHAQAEQIKWKAVANHRIGAQWKKWLWLEQELPKRTNGRLSIEVFTLGEIGLGGPEMLRVMRAGLVDIAEMSAGYVSGDFPLIEGTDLPGLVKSPMHQKQLVDSWLKNVVSQREDVMGGKVLASFFWNSSFLFSKYPVDSLDDIKGHKVRVNSPANAQWIKALGGEPLNMPMQEVYSALQRGVVDSLVTGPDQVKGISMWEVAPNMTALALPGGVAYIVVSKRSWDKLPADIREVFEKLGPELNELGWELGFENDRTGIDLAKEKGMKVTIPEKAEWQPTFEKIATETVLPWWIGRVGAPGRAAFNEHLAPIAGIQAQ
jgi:TRAP-type C4-dicarboxylate transport system substrate-binding protein